MIFHKNGLPACNIISYFFLKLEKMLQLLSSAAVVIGALRVNIWRITSTRSQHNGAKTVGEIQIWTSTRKALNLSSGSQQSKTQTSLFSCRD